MSSNKSIIRKGNRAVKLDVIGHIPLACQGDAFVGFALHIQHVFSTNNKLPLKRWDRKAIRTLAKYSRYLEVEGLFDWPKTARRELRSGFIVGAQSPQDVPESIWSVELLDKYGISGSDVGTFYGALGRKEFFLFIRLNRLQTSNNWD